MKKIFRTIVFSALFCSAMSLPVASQIATHSDVIEIAITDFLKCRLSKNFNAFLVSIDDISEYAPYKISDDIITINIFPAFLRCHITPLDTIGSTRLPTRHMIKDGKLFYWHDPDYGLTEEMVKVLRQFNIADSIDISDPSITLDDYTDNYIHHQVDGNTKGVDYYFCKNDSTNYKRVITSIGLGGYKPPTLKCNR